MFDPASGDGAHQLLRYQTAVAVLQSLIIRGESIAGMAHYKQLKRISYEMADVMLEEDE